MAGENEGSGKGEPRGNQPFVSGEERPEVRLNPDSPISELRVRDLSALISSEIAIKKPEFKDAKDVKYEKYEQKLEHKFEHKHEHKHEHKFEHKHELKLEHKFEHKHEKWEIREPILVPSEPVPVPGPDPRLDELIKAVSQLQAEVAELRSRAGGRQR